MKVSDRFKAELGSNIAESMGASATGGSGGPLPGAARGVPGRYDGVTRPREALAIPLVMLRPDPDQPRKDFDPEETEMLARSLMERGQLQPIRARWEPTIDDGRGAWLIVSGERRWRAARVAGLETLLVVEAKGDPSPEDILEDQLVENCVRSDLKPVEQAHAFKTLMDRRGYSGRQLAERLAISHTNVQRALALLALPEAVQAAVEQGILSPTTAAEVAKLEGPTLQEEVASAVVEQGLNRTEVNELVQAIRAKRPTPAAKPEPVSVEVEPGIVVKITWKKSGGPDELQVLRRALRMLQARRARDGQEDAA